MPITDHTDVVAAVKARLEAAGVDLHSPCGAFKITKRVAWELRAEGAGLLEKTTGNNCEGFAVDIVAYPDGSIFDCLINSETENRPAWQPLPPVDPSRYRAPTDPGDASPPPPPPPPAPDPEPEPPEPDIEQFFRDILAAWAETNTRLAALAGHVSDLVQELKLVNRNGVRFRL